MELEYIHTYYVQNKDKSSKDEKFENDNFLPLGASDLLYLS